MNARPEFAESAPQGFRLRVWVQPGARRDELAGLYQGCLKIRLAAPAVDNKANKALEAFVARHLGLKPKQVQLAAGQTSRKKTIIIHCDEEPAWAGLVQGEPGTL